MKKVELMMLIVTVIIKVMMIWASVVWAVGYCYDTREAAAGAK